MATWAMLKREKMNNQARQARFGSYGRFSANAEKDVPRDGKSFFVEPAETLESVASKRVMVRSLPAGHAQGLSASIGRVGKGGRVAFTNTHGDGARRCGGLTAESYSYVTELVKGR